MNSIVPLLLRHGLASLGGFFAAHSINGSSTSGIIVGLMVLAVPVIWSWVANLLRIDDLKAGTFDLGKNEIFRTLLGSLVSQGITALSVYFAVDADNPEALLVAIGNATASHFGIHQKALGMPGLKLMALASCLLPLASCSSLTSFAIAHEAEIESVIVYGARIGARAGIQRLKTSAKNPLPKVSPKTAALQFHDRENRYSTEPHKLGSVGSTPTPVPIPGYGLRVAAALQHQTLT